MFRDILWYFTSIIVIRSKIMFKRYSLLFRFRWNVDYSHAVCADETFFLRIDSNHSGWVLLNDATLMNKM